MYSKSEIENRVVDTVYDFGIRKTDEQGTLECFCSDNNTDIEFEKNIRGFIFDGNDLILKSLPYADEVENIEDDIQNYKISIMKEGTSIRVFHHKDKWFISTHRKIDAFKSKWGRESFGELFEKNIIAKTGLQLDEFLNTLDKNLAYIFLIGTNEFTRTVSPQYDGVVLIHCMDKKHNIIFNEELKDWYPKFLTFENIKEVNNFVDNLKYPFDEGIGLFFFSEKKSLKLYSKKYLFLSELRHNLPSIPFAYLHNVFDEANKKIFRTLYPNFTKEFDHYDEEINIIAKDLMKKYFRRFAKKEQFIVSKQEHNILYHIHGIFIKNRKPITLEDVLKAFSQVPPSNINKIISERKKQKKQAEKKE